MAIRRAPLAAVSKKANRLTADWLLVGPPGLEPGTSGL